MYRVLFSNFEDYQQSENEYLIYEDALDFYNKYEFDFDYIELIEDAESIFDNEFPYSLKKKVGELL